MVLINNQPFIYYPDLEYEVVLRAGCVEDNEGECIASVMAELDALDECDKYHPYFISNANFIHW